MPWSNKFKLKIKFWGCVLKLIKLDIEENIALQMNIDDFGVTLQVL
jgi:hypothetical protein